MYLQAEMNAIVVEMTENYKNYVIKVYLFKKYCFDTTYLMNVLVAIMQQLFLDTDYIMFHNCRMARLTKSNNNK